MKTLGVQECQTISYGDIANEVLLVPQPHKRRLPISLIPKPKSLRRQSSRSERTIELLEEYKHSLIEQAVTLLDQFQ